jgi:uncharacterized protein (DUF427 family)
MERAKAGGYPIVAPTPKDNDRDLQWWLRVLDAKAFLFSLNGSAAWLFPHYQLKLRPIEERVVLRFEGLILAQSTGCLELRETAHVPQIYVPREDVDPRYLHRSDKLTFCPFKNLANHFDVRMNGREIADAFWSYEEVYETFPENGNASDIVRLRGMLAPYRDKLDVQFVETRAK